MTDSIIKQLKLVLNILNNIVLSGWMSGSYTGAVLTAHDAVDFDHLQ